MYCYNSSNFAAPFSSAMAQSSANNRATIESRNLLHLMDRTGYGMVQENGQRKYGPPPDWKGPPPPKGSEVFVGKIPRDLYEDELVPVFERVGLIYEIRLMMDFSGSNRGYAFVMYTNPADAKKAVKELDNFEIRKGRCIGVCKSVDNCRLFVGGIPKMKTREEILEEMKKITEGVVDVILYSSVTDKAKNRGFAFVEYENHRAAAMARRKLIPGKIQLWGHEIAVDWAEPEPEVDEEVMSKVTVLYARNFMLSTTEDQISDAFSLNGQLKVEKVKKLRDFAFIHYKTREDAEQALQEMNRAQLDGVTLEVTWAKPAERANKLRSRSAAGQVAATLATAGSTHPAHWNGVGNLMCYSQPYGPLSPAINPPGSVPARVALRVRGRGSAGLRGNRGSTSGFGRAHGLYSRHAEHRFVDLQPGMDLIPANPYTLKPCRLPTQVLADFCQKYNWGEPVYQLHTTQPPGGENNQNMQQFFLYKVTIPNLHPRQSPYNNFQPTKLCPTMEEAKEYAAEYVLSQLGLTADGLDAPATVPHTLMVTAPGGGAPGLSLPPTSHGRLGPPSFVSALAGSRLQDNEKQCNSANGSHSPPSHLPSQPSQQPNQTAPPLALCASAAQNSATTARLLFGASSTIGRSLSTYDHSNYYDHLPHHAAMAAGATY